MSKAFLNWSGGKDSAMALYDILRNGEWKIGTLLTTINKDTNRVSMHGIRESLLRTQALHLNIPIEIVDIPSGESLKEYDKVMYYTMSRFVTQGFEYSVFGDIFLEDLRAYRDEKLGQLGLKGVYPLWKKNTRNLVKSFIDLGFKTMVVCVDAKLMDDSFVGRIVDDAFLNDLPHGVDPCGENGEFHTFVFDGPIFAKPVPFKIGEKVLKSYATESDDQSWNTSFWYCDLLDE